jgi:GAF domain-containing protein
MRPGDADREHAVSRAFVQLADTLVDDYDAIDLLYRLATVCVELLPADAAGIVLGDARQELHVVAASSEAAELMELFQLQNDEGPCLDCFQTAAPVSVDDLAGAADRWPAFVAAVAARGQFRAVHALPLRLRGQAIGALNLFDRQTGPLPPADLALAQALADVATIGILQERAIHRAEIVSEQLQTALTSRVTIEQAKGVLSQWLAVDVETAFDRLRGHARAHNLKLVEVARRIVRREMDPTQFGTPRPPRV